MARQLKVALPLPASLPYGPLRERAEDMDPLVELNRSIDENFASLVAVTTDILHDLQGIEPEQRASAARWTDGPQFVWRTLAAPRASDDTKSNPVSRAWKRTATWPNTAAAAKDKHK